MLDAVTAQTLREIVAKGAMPPLVLVVDDCRAAHDRMRACRDPSLLRSMAVERDWEFDLVLQMGNGDSLAELVG